MSLGSLTAGIPTELPEELVTKLVSGEGVRIERIVSHGHDSAEGSWYDQEESEFVLLVSGGEARLELAGRGEVVLRAGDWIDIPAHERHRVTYADPTRQTTWLVVFYRQRSDAPST